MISQDDKKSFLEQGYIIKPNFLSTSEFQALKDEIQEYKGSIRQVIEGNTTAERVRFTLDSKDKLPQCDKLIHNTKLVKLLRYTSSKNRLPVFHIENLIQDKTNSTQDPQQDLHTDTFHPCVKAWLFINDVTDENGPFNYVPKSHRLSWKRLKWEYKQSLIASRNRKSRTTQRYWDGSFRLGSEDKIDMGLDETAIINVKENTLVIANTHGFHSRGNATKTSHRLAVWMQARDNPFNPFFSPCPYQTARLFEKVWQPMSEKIDQRMLKTGQLKIIEGGFNLPDTGSSN